MSHFCRPALPCALLSRTSRWRYWSKAYPTEMINAKQWQRPQPNVPRCCRYDSMHPTKQLITTVDIDIMHRSLYETPRSSRAVQDVKNPRTTQLWSLRDADQLETAEQQSFFLYFPCIGCSTSAAKPPSPFLFGPSCLLSSWFPAPTPVLSQSFRHFL